MDLRNEAKSKAHVLKMSITAEDFGDAEVLHDYHRGEIDKGDVWLVVVFLEVLGW